MADLIWGVGRNQETDRVFIVDNEGGRVEIDESELPHLAAALSYEYPSICDEDDNERLDIAANREFVSGEWEA